MNADSLRRTTGFYPWRQLVGALVGPDYSTVDLTNLLADDPAMAALVPLLSPVLQTAISESESTAQLFGGGRAEKPQGVIIALLEHLIGPAPQVVIVEDAHWFDSASWPLLERFSRAFGHATLVPVCRPLDPDALPFEARRLLDMPGAQVIRLGPFSRAESVDLVNASLNVVETAPAIVELRPGGAATATLAQEIAAAQRAGLVEPVDTDLGRHRFHHAIIGDTAYKLLVSDQRRSLHAKTAEILSNGTAAKDYPAASLALLAHHFEQADLHVQAVDFLTRALTIVERQPQLANSDTRSHWNHKIADTLKALGHYQRAADFLFESARLLDRAPPTTTCAALVSALGSFAGYRLRPHRAAQPAAMRDPMIAAAEINMTLSEIHYELNKVPFSLAEVLHGVNLARSGGGDSTTLAKI